jgi:hypothetical protein
MNTKSGEAAARQIRRRRKLTFKPFPDFPDANGPTLGAVRALRDGVATAHQQVFLWELIIKQLAGVTMQPFVEGAEGAARQTDFNCGRQHVGYALLNLAEAPMPALPSGSGPAPD